MNMQITKEKKAWLKSLELKVGSHASPEKGVCAMEAVAFIAGEKHSDRPKCASPVIASFLRSWNDDLKDADRTRLIKPLIPLVVGTRTTDEDEETRAWMLCDWLIRESAPAWLKLAGIAGWEKLVALDEIKNKKQTDAVLPLLRDLKEKAYASASASVYAYAAAYASASASASASAYAYASAYASAYAADPKTQETIALVQKSAVKLVKRMCAVGRKRA